MSQRIETRIFNGDFDDRLDSITLAIRDRRRVMQEAVGASLRTGSTIKFNTSARPRYLQGVQAKVKKVNRASVVVDLPHSPALRRWSGATDVRCPLTIISKVEVPA